MKEQIQLIRHSQRAIRWLPSGMGLPVAWDEALRLIAIGRAVEITV